MSDQNSGAGAAATGSADGGRVDAHRDERGRVLMDRGRRPAGRTGRQRARVLIGVVAALAMALAAAPVVSSAPDVTEPASVTSTETGPSIAVGFTDGSGVLGVGGWNGGATVALSINGTEIASTEVRPGSGPAGSDFAFSPLDPAAPFSVEPGDVVVVQDDVPAPDTTIRTHVARYIAVEVFEDDTFRGAAPANEQVRVRVYPRDFGTILATRLLVAGDDLGDPSEPGAGEFWGDFSVPGSGPEEQDVVSSLLGNNVVAETSPDAEGNYTYGISYADESDARFFTVIDYGESGLFAQGWPPNTEVTISVAGSVDVSTTVLTDEAGELRIPAEALFPDRLVPGDVVTLNDGVTTQTVTLTAMTVTDVDVELDTVSGTAEPNSVVDVQVEGLFPPDPDDRRKRAVVADSSGAWTADFSVEVEPFGEGRSTDIVPGTFGWAQQADVGGGQTWVSFTAAGPLLSSISGTVYLGAPDPANALGGALVEGCTDENLCQLTFTEPDGAYLLDRLPPGDVRIRVLTSGLSPPAYVGPFALTAGDELTGIDIVAAEAPVAAPVGAVEPSSEAGGTVSVNWRDDLTLTAQGCEGGTATFTFTVFEDGSVIEGPMAESPEGSGTYTATVPALFPRHGAAEVTYEIACPDGAIEEVSFLLYIDPSGVVVDTTGEPVEGATVTLFRSDSEDGPFTQVPDGSILMSPSNRTNPDTTDARGRFGWDVVAGFYTVRAEKEGCHAPGDPGTPGIETDVLTIPPPVTDLELVLECPTAPADGDLVSIGISGGLTYNNSGAATDGDIGITTDLFGVQRVSGQVELPGAVGGSASVRIQVDRFLVFPVHLGQVRVHDPDAGLRRLEVPVLFRPLRASGDPLTVSSTASWFTRTGPFSLAPFTLEWSVTDRFSRSG